MAPHEERPSPDRARHVRLPPFVADPEDDDGVGLGDVIKRATSTVGIKPCGGCLRRAEWLNARVRLGGRRHG